MRPEILILNGYKLPYGATIIDEMADLDILEYEGGERPKQYVCSDIMSVISSERDQEVNIDIRFP